MQNITQDAIRFYASEIKKSLQRLEDMKALNQQLKDEIFELENKYADEAMKLRYLKRVVDNQIMD